MDYIYVIEVNCFKFDGQYEWRLMCRKKDDETDIWKLSAVGNEGTIQEAFDKAYYWKNKYEKV